MKKTLVIAALCLSALSHAQEQSTSIALSEWQFSKTALDAPDAKWEKVTVPHCWNATDAQQGGGQETKGEDRSDDFQFGYYRGPGSYKTSFPTAWDLDKNTVFIRFNAVSTTAKVALNGKDLGEHLGGFTSFGFDITGDLKKDGDNSITVAASNAYRKDVLPLSGDFPVYGGMYRPVTIEVKPKVCISPIVDGTWGVRTYQSEVSDKSAKLDIVTTIYNATGGKTNGTFAITLKDRDGKTVINENQSVSLEPGNNDIKKTVTVKNPRLWNGKADPHLYSLTVHVKTANTSPDSYTTNIGFRNVEFDPAKGLFLNGKHLQSFGVCLHQDWEGIGWALTPENITTNAEIMDEMGANSVRLAHYPHAQQMVDECDKRGIVVWCEIPYVDSVGKPKVDGIEEVTKRQLVEMIRQYTNHASIVTWGLGNELFHRSTVDPLPLLRELNALAHEEDNTRKTVLAVNRPNNKDMCSITDLLGMNAYPGWYGGAPNQMKAIIEGIHKNYPETPLSISEYGFGGSIKHHNRNAAKAPKADGPWHPEEYQSRAHEITWKSICDQQLTWGTFIWNLYDFASVWRNEGDKPGINDKGLVTFDRKIKKDAYYFYKANWRSDIPVLHIQERRATPTKDKEVKIRFYSNMKGATVTLNGTKVKAPKEYCMNGYETEPVELKPGKNTVTVTAKDSKGKTVKDEIIWELEA